MYGNVVTNKQLRNLVSTGCIEISNFVDGNVKASAYTLTPGRVLRPDAQGGWEVCHTFSARKPSFTLEENEYVLIEPHESVIIKADSIVGTFIVASGNIENGTFVVAGQLDSKYGEKGHQLRFGLKNLLNTKNQVTNKRGFLHIQFTDLRGSASDPVKLNKVQEAVINARLPEGWVEQNVPNYSAQKEDN